MGRFAQPVRSLFLKFQRSCSGVAAVEFALVLPFLVLLYLGTVEVTQGIILARKTTLTAAAVGNIVCQYTTISQTSQLPDIFNAATQIFAPYSTTPATITVTSIQIDSAGKATVGWSYPSSSPHSVGQTMAVPAQLDIPSTNLVLSEVSYAFTAPIDFLKLGTVNLYTPIYSLPRASTAINLAP